MLNVIVMNILTAYCTGQVIYIILKEEISNYNKHSASYANSSLTNEHAN